MTPRDRGRQDVLDILRESFPSTDIAFVEDRLRVLAIEAEAGPLEAAWQALEKVLPEGWMIERLGRIWPSRYSERWQAIAVPIKPKGRDWRAHFLACYGDTKEAALCALAERLLDGPAPAHASAAARRSPVTATSEKAVPLLSNGGSLTAFSEAVAPALNCDRLVEQAE